MKSTCDNLEEMLLVDKNITMDLLQDCETADYSDFDTYKELIPEMEKNVSEDYRCVTMYVNRVPGCLCKS